MTSPAPTLQCLSCGYDIASLVETRGRDDPGVCPECGEDLREAHHLRCDSCDYDIASIVAQRGLDSPGLCPECGEDLRHEKRRRPGHPVQHRITRRAYFQFVAESTLRPWTVFAAVWRTDPRADRYTILNCAVSSLACTPLIMIAIDANSPGVRIRIDEVLAILVHMPAGLLLGFMVLAYCVTLLLRVLGPVLWSRNPSRMNHMATAIGSSWLLACPALMVISLVIGLFSLELAKNAIPLAFGVPSLLMVSTAVRAMAAFQR